MPFLVQTALIRTLGIYYVGVQGVLTSILSVLSLAELGVGSAITYSLYNPIANDDSDTICALLNLYKRIYRIIGAFILIIGLILMPFIKIFFKDPIDKNLNIYLVFFLFLLNSVISYFLFAYKSCLLSAFQRTDVVNIVGAGISFCVSGLQIAVLCTIHNYYLVLIISLIFTVVNNIVISYQVDRMFPDYRCRGRISNEMLKDIRVKVAGVFITKLCATTRNAFDCIFISIFLGTIIVGQYSNYYYVMNAVVSVLAIFAPSIAGGVGNSIQLDSKEKVLSDMRLMNFAYMLLTSWCTTCMICWYQQFIRLWAGTESLFPFEIAILFTLYFYIRQMGNVRSIYADAAGLFWENRYRAILEAVCNIVLNWVLVMLFGVIGILLATIFTLLFIGFVGSTEVLFRCYFQKSMFSFLMENLGYIIVTVVVSSITYVIGKMLQQLVGAEFISNIVVCVIVAPILYLLFYFNTRPFKKLVRWVKEHES